jgi:hypothetical protein
MKRTTFFGLTLALLMPLSIVARDTQKELTINLKFVPQEGVQSNSPDLPSAMTERTFEIRVEDGRNVPNPLTIGQGTNDDDKSFPINAGSDVIAYVNDTLKQVSVGWGLTDADPKQRILIIRMTRFFVDESNKALGSVYTAEVKLAYVLTDAEGKRLSEGIGSGAAHRYGRSRSSDNCSEVLSDALKEAFADALSTSQLQTAWISGKASATSTSQSSPKESIEERLRKLDDLLKKGLITKEEYNSKRAEILKDV